MADKIAVFSFLKNRLGSGRVPFGKLSIFAILLFMPLFSIAGSGDPDYDEINVTVEVKDIGNVEVPALYADNKVFLSVTNIFDYLKIKNVPSSSLDTIRGFFINEADTFLIEAPSQQIIFKGKTYDLKPAGLIKSGPALYMELKYFKKVFGLDGVFNFRRLVVTMSSETELPAIREMKEEMMRRNVNKLQGDVKADTTIRRTYPMFHFGMADWAVMSSQQSQGPDQTNVNLGLGALVAGGELNASLNYYSTQAFTEKLQYYQWRYVNNDNEALRQVVAGKIFAQATSTLYAPVVGIQFTNAPTVYRKSYGSYTLTNTTQPGWTVELYVNDVLIDYKKADASGQYTFQVPLFYGFTIIKLRFFGPYGEERTAMQYVNIPFNFLPLHEFEYAASGGIVEDGKGSRFGRFRVNYGLSRNITVGAGIEYLSSVTSGATMPFVNTSIRFSQQLLFTGEYTYSVRARGVLTYRLPSGMQLDVDYTKYDKGQTAIYYNYLEERKVSLTTPFYRTGFSLLSRITVDQIVVPNTQYTNLEWAMTGFIQRVGFNLTTYSSVVQNDIPYIYSILGLMIPLPAKMFFTPQIQYDFKSDKAVFAKFNLEKKVFEKGYVNIQFQDYFESDDVNVLLGLRYDFNPAKVATSFLQGNNNTYSRVEAASGSFMMDRKSDYYSLSNGSSVGRGGIVIEPFLDVNCNGRKDPGEPRVAGLKLRITGGRVFYDDDDSTIRIFDLEPYISYFIELDKNSFDNVAWQIKNKTLNVTPNPNDFRVIEVPVAVVAEVSGTVSVKTRGKKGQGQVIVNVYKDSVRVARAITESDGYFSYLGLVPGTYNVRIDSVQLHNLHMRAQPASLPVTIKENKDGDVADGLDFTLIPEGADTNVTAPVNIPLPPLIEKKEPEPKKQVIGEKGSYAILVDVYPDIKAAGIAKTKLTRALQAPVTIVQTGDDFEVEITGFPKRKDAEAFLPTVEKMGYKDALIVRLNDRILR